MILTELRGTVRSRLCQLTINLKRWRRAFDRVRNADGSVDSGCLVRAANHCPVLETENLIRSFPTR